MIGEDVSSAILAILNGHAIPPKMNHTFVTLIPKKPKAVTMLEYWPISLCNVIYKLVTKVITNKLKDLLLNIISDTQSAFTPGRVITDNILIAYEIFHFMHGNTGTRGPMAIKLDMSKAYDRVEWSFLRRGMLRIGF